MKVLGVDVSEGEYSFLDKFCTLSNLEEFLKEPRFVVLCVPLNSKMRGMFDERHFVYMRDDAIFINVSRGEVVKQGDLIKALQSRSISGAILDVFEEEPLPKTSPLWEMSNVVVTPHIVGPNVPEEMVKFFVENLRRFRGGDDLLGLVD